jgi:O-methyltransferase
VFLYLLHCKAVKFLRCRRWAKDIVDWIWDKMVHGGIIVYDDYGFNRCDGITKYVEEQMNCRDRLVIYNLNGHAIILKL